MTKKLPPKSARKPQKPKFVVTEAMQRRMEAAMSTVAHHADKDARNDDKTQREARAGLGATFDSWAEHMTDIDPNMVAEIFFQFGCFATATNRKRILKHAHLPTGVEARIEAQLEAWKASEAEKTEADRSGAQPEQDRPAE